MVFGVVCGCVAAAMQSTSYVFSRLFISRYKSAMHLAVYSQILMGVMGFILLGICSFFTTFPWSLKYILFGAAWVVTYVFAQTSFFMALKTVEASRLSSLLGTKIIVLALMAVLLGNHLTPSRWLAVVLCTISAVGMNFTGGKLSLKSMFWIGMAVLNYSLCDLSCTEMVKMMPGNNVMVKSYGVVAVSYAALGVLSLPALLFVPRKKEYFRDALPFSAAWFISMTFLLSAFGSLGVVYGTILQSGRGIVSVVIGAGLLYFGFEHLEPRVNKRAWIRRLCMAILMLTAMVIYSVG